MNGAGPPLIDPGRVIADLHELRRRTAGPDGARRLAWGEEWRAGRAYVAELLSEIGLEPERDEAGNLWAYLAGSSERAVAVGSHTDSVPNGGWLDGALGVMAAIGVARAFAEAEEKPELTVAMVDWADEEGARFGRSLFGSSAVAGTLKLEEMESLSDREGRSPREVLAENEIDLAAVPRASARRERLAACLELHIEQGPVLEAENAPAAAVAGCAGVERRRFTFTGQASHAGTTPMEARRDAGLAAARTALAVEEIAIGRGGVGTVGAGRLQPGIVTAVPGRAEVTVDLRHPDAKTLERMLKDVRTAAATAAGDRGCELDESTVWRIDPVPFDSRLVEAARDACAAAGGREEPLISGALHDAAEIARHVPTAMVFAPSIRGISHAAEEDTSEADLTVAIDAYGAVACALAAGEIEL